MASHVRIDALYAAIDAARTARGLSWRDVAVETELSASTLSRLGRGKRPDIDGFASLVQWLGVPAEEFMITATAVSRPELEVRIALAVSRETALSSADRQFLQDVLNASIRRIKHPNGDGAD